MKTLLIGGLALVCGGCLDDLPGRGKDDPRDDANLITAAGVYVYFGGGPSGLAADEVTRAVDERIQQWIDWRTLPAGGNHSEVTLRERAAHCLVEVLDDSHFREPGSPTGFATGLTSGSDGKHPKITVCWYAASREEVAGSPPHTIHGGGWGFVATPGCPALMHELDHAIGIGHAPDPLAHW